MSIRFYSAKELDEMGDRISELVKMDFSNLPNKKRTSRNIELIFLKNIYEAQTKPQAYKN
ncbi:MAG: hypothetical protein AABX93_00940 [Nanoarchaeota archaeon]